MEHSFQILYLSLFSLGKRDWLLGSDAHNVWSISHTRNTRNMRNLGYTETEEQAMPDSLADRLNRRSEQQRQQERSQTDAIEFQNRVNTYISENARPEYDKMMGRLKRRAEEGNPATAN